jgi:hypothetical protein
MGDWMRRFLTSALVGGGWSASLPGRFTPRERAPDNHSIGDRVGYGTGLDDLERRKILSLIGLELLPLSNPACSKSLYRMRYPSSPHDWIKKQTHNTQVANTFFVHVAKPKYLGN